MKINANYRKLKDNYLFYEIDMRVRRYREKNPSSPVISLGIGDVTLPISPHVSSAIKKATDETAAKEGLRGYGPYQGYDFLRESVSGYYAGRNVNIHPDEIYVSDGAKSDLGNILDIFSEYNSVLIPDPVYPTYVDTNVMDGRSISFMNATKENAFRPMPGDACADIIYICSPNNPTGAVYTRPELKSWVDYALEKDAIILFDAAYEAFVRDTSLPRSIFEIDGARGCAIEFCSLSKTAGFTGLRCSYTVIPKELKRGGASLGEMWLRRQSTKYNGLPYIIQRGAEAALSSEGLQDSKAMVSYYLENTGNMRRAFTSIGLEFEGGLNSPYIWLKCPDGMSSWDFFDHLLNNASIVGTPGSGFGENGEGYFRLTGFGDSENVKEALYRLENLIK